VNNINVSKKFKPLFSLPDNVHTFILTGGRNSQKSFAASLASVNACTKFGHRVLYSRYTNASLRDSIYTEVEEKIDMLNVSTKFDMSYDRISATFNKSKIVFKGLKAGSKMQTANLKGLKDFSMWILDEAEELTDEDIYDKISLSIRGNKKSSGIRNVKILILNPSSKEHFVHKRYFQDAGVKDGWNGIKNGVCYIHTTYMDCLEFTPEESITTFEYIKKNNINKYNHIVLGGWLDKAEGVVFDNWEYGEFNPDNLQTSYGQDYGFSIDPTTLCEVSIDKKKKLLYVKELLYKPKLTTSQIASINLANAERKLIVGDSAEPRLIDELRSKGCNIKPVEKGAGSISAGIALMQDYKIIVEQNSINIATELNNYVYADKGSKLYVDAFNHAIDAIRYNVFYHLGKPNRNRYDIR
jgi:phage terminase large subunit